VIFYCLHIVKRLIIITAFLVMVTVC